MIFSTETREIYWILSILLINYDISIINKIMNTKREIENKDNVEWYIRYGIEMNKLKISDHKELFLKHILFNPYDETYGSLRMIHVKIFHYKILFETFMLPGFILNYSDNKYSLPKLSEHIAVLNYYIKRFGIYEIHNCIFQYNINNLTDIIGNKCIRSIIRSKSNNHIIYEYKTIALIENGFKDPIERMATLL